MGMDLLTCPRCESEMDRVKEPDLVVDRCPECGGTFFDKGELDELVDEVLQKFLPTAGVGGHVALV
jgi:Zn-finger nucleic acid-binding protein